MLYDAHTHVFRPGLPLRSARRYTPTTVATPQHLLEQLERHGLVGALLVQPSFLADHDHVLQVAQAYPERFRVVASPASLRELEQEWDEWVAAGVVGVRLNLVGRDLPDLAGAQWRAVAGRLAAADLHLEVHAQGEQWRVLGGEIPSLPCKVVIDHLGRTGDVESMVRLGGLDHVWFKVSAPYRWPDQGAGAALVAQLIDTTDGARLVWGSDWPFTQHEHEVTYSGVLALAEGGSRLHAVADGNLQRLLGGRRFGAIS